MDIVCSKLNESFWKVDCERGTAQELSEYFSFMVPGYQFIPSYRNRFWDGKYRLFDQRTKTINYGLYEHLRTFSKERQYTIDFLPEITATSFSLEEANRFTDALKLPYEVRDYQLMSFAKAVRDDRMLLLSPTASGKSLIAYIYIRWLQLKGLKGLLLVPTTGLVEQMYSDFDDYAKNVSWNSEGNVHRIYEGHSKTSELPIFVSTWQSIYKQPKEYFEQFDWIIGDEAHLGQAKSISHIVSSCVNAKHRIGMTGSLTDTKVHSLILEGLYGPIKRFVTTKELIDRGQLAKFQIKTLLLKHTDDECKAVKKMDYPEEIDYLISNQRRNEFIINLAKSLKGNTLVLFQRVEKHGEILFEMLKGSKKQIYFIAGKTETEERELVRKYMELHDDIIAVASARVFGTGTNIKNLHNIIFAAPSKSKINTLQTIGRSLRLNDNKDIATLFDIADDLRWKQYENYTLGHYQERLKIYDSEGFPWKQYQITI